MQFQLIFYLNFENEMFDPSSWPWHGVWLIVL